jgi:ribose transport system substrate-binding protein
MLQLILAIAVIGRYHGVKTHAYRMPGERNMLMRKLFVAAVSVCCLVTFLFSAYYAVRIYRSYGAVQTGEEAREAAAGRTRIALITQEAESPFTKALQLGTERYAKADGMDVMLWASYRSNLAELIKNMDIAIAAKVDGIIVQAMDGPEFVETAQKATQRGIPVITVGADAPTSLRKSYVGPSHAHEGELIGSLAAAQMNGEGTVYLLSGRKMTSTEQLRLQGVRQQLAHYPGIRTIVDEGSENELDRSQELASDALNRHPQLATFIGLNSEAATGIVQALEGRGRGRAENVYAFDDTPELRDMVLAGRITATLSNDNTTIGETSLRLIRQWMNNVDLPLPEQVYTEVTVVKGKNGR